MYQPNWKIPEHKPKKPQPAQPAREPTMASKFGTWRQKINQHRVAVVAVAIILVVIIALIIIGYRFNWTGFDGYDKVTREFSPSGQLAKTTKESQPEKTLWDWLQLLIVPIIVAIGGFWLNQIQKSREQKKAEQQAELELELTHDNQHEAALQAYINAMSELLLEKKLRESQPKYEVREIARVRTLTVLPQLDAFRKRSVLQFLQESGLIGKGQTIIDLSGADLSGAKLGGADLIEADLSKANLSGADLISANLSRANLSRVFLWGANLSGAILTGAYLDSAILVEADLSRADLSGTDLIAADLSRANLSRADLNRAILNQAIGITTKELEKKARSLQGAIMPNGEIHP